MSKIAQPINFIPYAKESSEESSSIVSDGDVYEIKTTMSFLTNFFELSNTFKTNHTLTKETDFLINDKQHLIKTMKDKIKKEDCLYNLNIMDYFPKIKKKNSFTSIKGQTPVPSFIKLTNIIEKEKNHALITSENDKKKQNYEILNEMLKVRPSTTGNNSKNNAISNNIKNILLSNLVLQDHNGGKEKKIFPQLQKSNNKFQKTLQLYDQIK